MPMAKARAREGHRAGGGPMRCAQTSENKINCSYAINLGPFQRLAFIKFSLTSCSWVGRSRTVGLQRGERTEGTTSPPSHDRQMDDPEMELDFTNLRHRRVASFGSQFDEMDAMDAMPSPYSGSSYSSYAGGSSVPSTPGAGTHTPVYAYSSNVQVGGAASPIHMGLGLSSMTLSGSAYRTPKSVTGGLPEEGDADESHSAPQEEVRDVPQRKEQTVEEVKIVGMDVEGEAEDGVREKDGVLGKMDVDV
ncbi:hypothetical protein DXG01_008096 [Tephrocybe rancida]|nr:hypothetical protein DXG01_008096 [Tephrocybe rancida]